MDAHIVTPRLLLTRLTNTEQGSQHVQWFHENISDKDAMAWSIRGPGGSLEESRELIELAINEYDNYFYAVHLLRNPSVDIRPQDYDSARGELLGSVNLRLEGNPVFPPPPRPVEPGEHTQHAHPAPEVASNTDEDKNPKYSFCVLGYQFFKRAWGKGYATEANAGLIAAYKAFVNSKNEHAFVEAHVDLANKDSVRVAEKLGMSLIGSKGYKDTLEVVRNRGYEHKLQWFEENGEMRPKLMYGGKWRELGFYVYGMWV